MMHVKNKWKEVKPARVNETEIKIISALLLHATIWSFVPFFYPLPTSLGSSVLLSKSMLEWHAVASELSMRMSLLLSKSSNVKDIAAIRTKRTVGSSEW